MSAVKMMRTDFGSAVLLRTADGTDGRNWPVRIFEAGNKDIP